MESTYKEVYFEYCETCKFKKESEEHDECDYCLENPVNLDSHKPVNYKPVGGKQ